MITKPLLAGLTMLSAVMVLMGARPAGEPGKDLISDSTLRPSSADVSVTAGKVISVKIATGSDAFPGIAFVPIRARNLSMFGHIEATLVNTGDKPINIGLRVDNVGDWKDNPWNTESVNLQPGQSGTVRTIFGYQYGYKKGFALDSKAISNILVFTTKSDQPQSFRIESLTAGGDAGEKPPVAESDIRVVPKQGRLLDASIQYLGESGATASFGSSKLMLTYPAPGGVVRAKLEKGRWDLRQYTQLAVNVRNVGSAPVTPRIRLESNGGNSDWFSPPLVLGPQAESIVTIPFGKAIDLGLTPQTGLIASDAIAAVTIELPSSSGVQKLEISSVLAEGTTANTPDWIGKRPPVAGEWVPTLKQEFEGKSLNLKIWKVTGENYYDKTSHWSKDNVVLENGMVKLRYEKKQGFQNDDPKRDKTGYASGFLDTYGLWSQKYGYFEARMKMPKSPGLWPAFWMMPDRGAQTGEQWQRQDTANGGMEFDIMEHLTRWGPHRFNIAMHYDVYGAEHKQPGTDKIYAGVDKDGFITCGLLWTPGLAVYYYNGVEVLRWKNDRISSVPSVIMFTLPMGGWDNDGLDDARLPADFAIDYVRVWQRKDLMGTK